MKGGGCTDEVDVGVEEEDGVVDFGCGLWFWRGYQVLEYRGIICLEALEASGFHLIYSSPPVFPALPAPR